MKKTILLASMIILLSGLSTAASDSFEDGDYTNNPSWTVQAQETGTIEVNQDNPKDGSFSLMTSSGGNNGGPRNELVKSISGVPDGETVSTWVYVEDGGNGMINAEFDYRLQGPGENVRFRSDYSGNIVVYNQATGTSSTIVSGISQKTFYKLEFGIDKTNNQVDFTVYDVNNNQLGSDTFATNINYDTIYMGMADSRGYPYQTYWDLSTYGFNSAPSIDSKSFSPSDPDFEDSVDVSMSASDADGDDISGSFSVWEDSTKIVDSVTASEPTTNNFEYSNLFNADSQDSTYTIQYEVSDGSATTQENLTFNINDKDPIGTLRDPKNNTIYGSKTVDFDLWVKDDGDEVASENSTLEIFKDGATDSTYSVTEGDNLTGSVTYSADGSHSLKAVITESSGESTSKYREFTVDSEKPNVTIYKPDGKFDGTTGIPLEYTAKDATLDSSSCEYSKDGGTNISLSNCQNSSISYGSIGQHSVTVYASDATGKTGKDTKTFQIDILNQIEARDKLTGTSINDFQVKLENSTHSLQKSTSNGTVNFYTSQAPTGTVDLSLKSTGYAEYTAQIDLNESSAFNETVELEKTSFSLSVFDEQTGNPITKPKKLEMRNGTENLVYTWGNTFEDYNNWGEEKVSNDGTTENPDYVFDSDLSTYGTTSVSQTSSTVDPDPHPNIVGLVSLRDGQNTIHILAENYGDTEDDSWLKKVELQKNTGTWTTIYDKQDNENPVHDPFGKQWFNLTVDNSNGEFNGRIRVTHHGIYGDNSFYGADYYEIFANNLEAPEYNITDIPTGETKVSVDDNAVSEYQERTYTLEIGDYSKISVDAYLLKEGEGFYITVETLDPLGSKISNTFVSIQKRFSGQFKQVANSKTGSDGSTSFYLDPDIQYKAVASHPSYSTFEGTFSPANYQYDPLRIQLGEASNFTQTTVWSEVDYKLLPDQKTLNKSDTYNFTFTVNDPEGKLSSYGVRIKDSDGSLLKADSSSSSPNGGSLNVSFNVSSSSVDPGENLVVEGFIFRSDEQNLKEYVLQKQFSVSSYIEAGITSIKSIMKGFSSNSNSNTTGILGMIILLGVSTGLKQKINKKGSGMITLAALGIMTLTGWFSGFTFILTALALAGIYSRG